MTLLLHVLLYLLLASFAALGLAFAGPRRLGPEGAVGVWLVFVPSLVLALLFLVAGTLSGRFAWMLTNRFASLVLSAGILVCLAVSLFSLLDRGPRRRLGMAATMLIGAACFVSLHPGADTMGATRRIAALVLFTTPALAGHALLLGALFRSTIGRRVQLEAEERAVQEAIAQRHQQDLDSFLALPVDAPFFAVSQYLWSPSESVQAQARARLEARPDLEAQMLEGLGIDGCDEAVARYIAYVERRPSPTLVPAYAAFLDRQLASWRRTRLAGVNPAQWESNLRPWFDAADRIQQAGGDLRPSLSAWHETLSALPGFEGLVQRIARIG